MRWMLGAPGIKAMSLSSLPEFRQSLVVGLVHCFNERGPIRPPRACRSRMPALGRVCEQVALPGTRPSNLEGHAATGPTVSFLVQTPTISPGQVPSLAAVSSRVDCL
jgi:hypothetical protein